MNKQNKLSLLKTVALSFALVALSFYAKAQNPKIKCYFTQPVDNTFSSGVNATYLNNLVFDTLAAYINRAKYTIDIAQYEYKTYTGDPIYTALNAAHTRGVLIRYIKDAGASNTGVALLTSSIPVLTSPTSGSSTSCGSSYSYGISHNKFVIIDEYSPDTTKAIVWTGSPDWDQAMSQGDYNNVIIFQSKQLAQAYTHEFNIMWGDTTHGAAANTANSLFGPCKPNSGSHIFYIGGSKVELYFSPSDGVNNEIVSTIATGTRDLYCGMFTFTETTDATDIVNQQTAGATAYAILDQYSSGSYTPYTTTLPNGLHSHFVGFVSSSYIYHNKYLVVNPSSPCNDPKVLTGSHNWTSSADHSNDENTVIVHDATVANIYLQAFAGDFKAISGTAVTAPTNTCSTSGINAISNNVSTFNVFPNPFNDVVTINMENAGEALSVRITNQLGQVVLEKTAYQTNEMNLNLNELSTGVYFISVTSGNNHYTQKLIK
ncbi:MAG: phospholipase D-like domain-containing protein [Bacteroidia bacterium]